MPYHTTGGTGFSHKLAEALFRFGYQLLAQPERLVDVLNESIQGDPALNTLSQNCTTRLLAPFYNLACKGQRPSERELEEAARDAEVYLVQERNIEQSDAVPLCMQLAQGVLLYLDPQGEADPWQDDNADPDDDTDVDKRKRWLKRLPLVAAALVLLAVGAYFLMTVSVSFNGNGSTSGSMSSVRVWKGRNWEVPSCEFSKSGYTFLGWNLNGVTHHPHDELAVSQDCTLKALWGATVSFDANGGSGSMDDVAAGSNGYLALPTCGYHRSDYEFVGWSAKKRSWSSNPTVYEPGEGVTVTGPTTYYAIWAPLASFDSNGGSGSMADRRISPNGTVTLPKNNRTLTRSGYRFVGWSTTKNGTRIKSGSTVTVNGPTTFYAVWRPLASFDANGGSGSMDSVAAKKSGKLTLPHSTFTRSDYGFLGWATSSTGTPKAAGETVTISEPTTFYARWGAKVSFDANGGSGSTASVYADANGKLVLPTCGFTYADHVFDGWASSSSGSGLYDPGESVSASSPKTYYATWKLEPNILDKVGVEQITKTADDGACVIILFVKNNSHTTLEITGTIDFKDASGTLIKTTNNTAYAVAPGERTLIYNDCDGAVGGPGATTYRISAQETDASRGPIYPRVRVEELQATTGKLVVRLHNNTGKRVYLVGVECYGTGSYGAWSAAYGSIGEYLDPGASTDVTIDDTGWLQWNQRTREYYVNGYTKL